MERLRAAGDFAPPAPGTLEDALRGCLALGRGRVFADTWDLGLFEADPERRAAAAERIGRMNATQRPG
jgi:hypothetical protein